MKLMLLILLLATLFPGAALADITEGGTGMLFGADHAFKFTAPKGWVLDNQSGAQQGLHMVFYPANQTWSKSPVMAYGVSVPKDRKVRSIQDQVKNTIEDFHYNGSPQLHSSSKR